MEEGRESLSDTATATAIDIDTVNSFLSKERNLLACCKVMNRNRLHCRGCYDAVLSEFLKPNREGKREESQG